MASELETNARIALDKMAKALAEVTTLTVETRYKLIDPKNPNNMDDSTLAARTEIDLDGDQQLIVPVTASETGGVVIDNTLLDLHLRNVQSSIEYRANLLNTLINLVRPRSL